MRKLAVLLTLALMAAMCAVPAGAETTYSQAPMLDEKVESGALPPVEERLPEVPKITDAMLDEDLEYECGNYGGTLRTCAATVNWDPDVFCGMNEALLTMRSQNSDVITPNIVEAYEVNDDYTEFTFHLRKGLKWSDGVEVTMEDFEFTMNDVIFNTDMNPVLNNYFRAGGTAAGAPAVFEVVDDYTYKISFESTYGGFLVYLSVSGWTSYADYLKPAHILKQFHPAYAVECHGSEDAFYDFLKPFAAAMGYDDPREEDTWIYVFNQVDLTTWETTNPPAWLTSETFEGLVDWNFPTLYPWIMVSSEGGVTTWERNPYYFKVDPDGQQLPYIDYVTSTYVEDSEIQQLYYVSGDADFGVETVTATNITLYMENAEKGNYSVYTPPYHYSPTDIAININYGLNSDGTMKDDDGARAWQEVVGDIRFRKALMLAIDADEVVDTIYNGLAEVYDVYECTGDIDAANALLDEMGMADIDGDGYRETPSGLKLEWMVWNSNRATDQVPACELYVEFWREIGLNVTVFTGDTSYVDLSVSANEVPMYVMWYHEHNLWHYLDWGIGNWAPLYNKWVSAGGLTGQLEGDEVYLEPTEEFINFYSQVQQMLTVSPTEAVNELLPAVAQYMANDLITLIVPITNAANCVILNSDIGNVPTGGLGIALNFSMEQFFYNNPEEH